MQIQSSGDHVVRDAIAIIRSQTIGMWRFRWLALSVAWALCIVGWGAVYSMPDIYSANARVFVDTENAIDDFLGGIAAPTDVMSDVSVVVREIVSRPNLAEVARNTDLALRAQTEAEFNELLTSLQSRISVAGNREGVYSISFADADRDKALAVVDTLLTAFVERSLGADRSDSAQAQEFLQQQIAEYDDRLTIAEDRLATFKRDNVALMPDKSGDLYTRMRAAEAGLQETENELNLALERRGALQRQIEGEEPIFGIMGSTSDPNSEYSSAKIRALEVELKELRLQFTDKHPRIRQILDTIDLLRHQEAEIRAQGGGSQEPNLLDLNPVYQSLRVQLANVEVELAGLQTERDQKRKSVGQLRKDVELIPQVEAELNRLNRDYDVIKANHQQLLQQLETANIGEEVSRSIDEVQFRIIDPPYSDIKPVGPNRPLFLSAVLVMGVGAAGVLAFLMNQLNPTFIGNRSVSDVLGIPVLASVSLLQSDDERQIESRSRQKLQMAAAALLVSFAILLIYAEQGSMLLRRLAMSIS